MALSNQTGALLLSTGNKSEMATGYATLYGDMCGAFAPLKDVYKTKVFELSRYRKLPERVITKAPTAELRPNQKDEDSLPPYNKLDAILHGLIEENLSLSEITTRGFDADTVNKVAKMLDLSEYKRRQSAPGVKISTRAFGRDRRYPMTNKYNRKDQ
jgi:NAD+ synthetase